VVLDTAATLELVADTVYVQQDGRRMVVVRGADQNCDVVGNAQTISSTFFAHVAGSSPALLRGEIDYDRVAFVNANEMRTIMTYCDEIHARNVDEDDELISNELLDDDPWRRRDSTKSSNSLWSLNPFNRILILPGTKWCGQGDVAEHYNDLGFHAETDKCCRSVYTIFYNDNMIIWRVTMWSEPH
jgi:hypothetical protein